MRAVLIEQGNGFPRPGAYVVGRDGNLYRVVAVTGHIMQDDSGQSRGERMHCEVERAEWSDCPEGEEHSARVGLIGD